MERIEYEFVAYVWSRSRERYVQLGISLSGNYHACEAIYGRHRDEWQSNMSDYDFDNYHIKFRKIVYTDWEVIYE